MKTNSSPLFFKEVFIFQITMNRGATSEHFLEDPTFESKNKTVIDGKILKSDNMLLFKCYHVFSTESQVV